MAFKTKAELDQEEFSLSPDIKLPESLDLDIPAEKDGPDTKEKSRFRQGLDKAFSQENISNIIIPLAAIVESIGTKGRSPGLAALQQGKIIESGKQAKAKREQEKTRQGILEKRLAAQEAEGIAKQQDAKSKAIQRRMEQEARQELAQLDPNDPKFETKKRSILARLPGTTKLLAEKPKAEKETPSFSTEEIAFISDPNKTLDEKRAFSLQWLAKNDPQAAIKFATKKEGRDPMEIMAEVLEKQGALKMQQFQLERQFKKPSQTEFQAAQFALRMEGVENIIDNLENKGFDPTTLKNAVTNFDTFNFAKSPELRQYAQAQRNFINAQLRRESGAAIAPSEFDSANKQYFAQFGDDEETLRQKKANRMIAQAALQAEAGIAYNEAKKVLEAKQAQTGGGIPIITSQEQADALPSGARFREREGGPIFVKP